MHHLNMYLQLEHDQVIFQPTEKTGFPGPTLFSWWPTGIRSKERFFPALDRRKTKVSNEKTMFWLFHRDPSNALLV